MFDKNDPTDLATLKALVPDPTIGTQDILDFLKSDSITLGVAPMTAQALLKALFPVSINSQDQFKIQLMFEGTADLNSDLSIFKTDLIALGGQIPGAVNSITRLLSIAEEAFSDLDENGINEFVVISRDDWIAARES